MSHEVDTLDPHRRNRLSNLSILSHFYEPLVCGDAAMQARPCLATRWDNPDLLTWVFHLREDVRFHDGRPLDAGDVVFSFERLMRDPTLGMSPYVLNVASVRALSPHTVEVRTRTALAILLNKIRFVSVVPKGSTAEGLDSGVNGTGPWLFREWQRNARIEMERNDAYWGPKPAFGRATFRLARGAEDAAEDFRRGRSDLVQSASGLVETRLGGRDDVTVLRNPSIFVKALGFDLAPLEAGPPERASNPFRDRRVREAAQLSIDKPALVAKLSSPAVPASQMVPPFIFGYDASIPDPRRDLPRARALLVEAGYPAGVDVVLHARRLLGETARLVAPMLEEAGIRVRLVLQTDAEYFESINARRATFFLSRWGCPAGDASDLLDNVVYSRVATRFGGRPEGLYANPALDLLLEESATVLDMSRRRSVLQSVLRLLAEDRAWIPLYVDEEVFAVRSGLAWVPRHDNLVLAHDVSRAVAR